MYKKIDVKNKSEIMGDIYIYIIYMWKKAQEG